MQGSAAAHDSWQVLEDLKIQRLTLLDWPSNSPDLNEIEPCWYWMKSHVTKHAFKRIIRNGKVRLSQRFGLKYRLF